MAKKKAEDQAPEAAEAQTGAGDTQAADAPAADAADAANAPTEEAPTKSSGSSKEFGPVIPEGYWVRLAAHKDVPDDCVGHIAAIISSPWQPVPYGSDSNEVIHGWKFDKKALFTVQTRDQFSHLLTLPPEAFQAVADSRAALTSHA